MNEAELIYRRSFAIVRRRLGRQKVAPQLRPCLERIVHAAASLRPVANLIAHREPMAAATAVLRRRGAVFCDVRMVAIGIKTVKPSCLINDKRVIAEAERLAITRSRAAVRHWLPSLKGSLVVIGNAPTALDELLKVLRRGEAEPPTVIFAFCCGFVGAAAAKRRLVIDAPCPYLTLRGRGGGSAIAAAAVNSILL